MQINTDKRWRETMKYFLSVVLSLLICVFPVLLSGGTLNGYQTESKEPEVTGCFVSAFPFGAPLLHVPESNGSSNGTVWLNGTGLAASSTIKYTVEFLQPGTPVKKSVTQFSNTGGSITTPFAFP